MKLAVAVLIAGTALPAQSSLGDVSSIILPKNMRVARIWHHDLSGDGRADLVIAVISAGRSYARSLRIHYDQGELAKTPFGQEPDAIIELPRSVSACAIGDVHRDPGSELIWFGARGVYAFRPRAEPEDAVVKIVACEFLYQFPQSEDVHSWQDGVRDIDGDGFIDLLLPEPGGYRIAIQTRLADGHRKFRATRLELPTLKLDQHGDSPLGVRAGQRAGRFDFGLEFSGRQKARPPLVAVTETVPAPQLRDWDADGDLDLIVKHGQHVLVWLQAEAGEFDAEPAVDLIFPLTAAQTDLDPSYGAWLTDFDGDHRVDALLLARDRNTDDLRSQILFFHHDQNSPTPLFHGGRPEQLLILAGLALPPKMIDIDGDGLLDLQIGSWRLDILDQLTAGDNRSLDGELYIYLNHEGRYSRRPDLTYEITLSGEQLANSSSLLIEFFADVNGDGISDLLLREKPEEVKLQLVRRRNGELSILPRPIWRMQVDKQARIEILPANSQRPGFLVLESDRVLLVRF